MVPKKIFFTKGVGKHKERLTSFELALRDAGIASQNLVRVSSIFPPQCKVITRKEGLKYLDHGEVVFSVIAENSTREPHRLIVSSIGVAIPADKDTYGYLSEHHSFGETEDQAGEYAEELAAEMLATTLDVDFDPDKSWDEKKRYAVGRGRQARTVDHDDCRGGFDPRSVGIACSRPLEEGCGWGSLSRALISED
jgi:arginine decarboxylase